MGNGELLDLLILDGLHDPYSNNHMGLLAENTVEQQGVSREEQDIFAIRSYRLAQAAIKNGIFADEIVPVVRSTRKGEGTISEDEEPGRVKFDKLPVLRGAFKKDGTVTAGNASTINDGAAMTLLASADAVEKYRLEPKARLVAYASNSVHPDDFTLAPLGAIQKVLDKAGLVVEDIDLFEINEAFSAVTLFAMRKFNLDPEKVNVNGGAVAIGHPLGASGARITATLVRELKRQQCRYGLATLCIGGGESVAAIFERI